MVIITDTHAWVEISGEELCWNNYEAVYSGARVLLLIVDNVYYSPSSYSIMFNNKHLRKCIGE